MNEVARDEKILQVLKTAKAGYGKAFPLHPYTQKQMSWTEWVRLMLELPPAPQKGSDTHG